MAWDEAYRAGFSNPKMKPGLVVQTGMSFIKAGSSVLDVGCGTGRNSIYAASLGHIVDAVDTEDADILKDVVEEVAQRVRFHKKDIFDFDIEQEYQAAIMTRLIMYHEAEKVQQLFRIADKALSKDGILMITYTESGGIPSKTFGVDKYEHPIANVEEWLGQSGFQIGARQRYEGKPKHVEVAGAKLDTYTLVAYDLLCVRK